MTDGPITGIPWGTLIAWAGDLSLIATAFVVLIFILAVLNGK